MGVRARVAGCIGMALTVAALGCSSGDDRPAATTQPEPTTTVEHDVSTSVADDPPSERGCTQPREPSTEVGPPGKLDLWSLRSNGGYRRLPEAEGYPLATVLLDGDLVVLERSISFETVHVGDTDSDETLMLDAELRLRRIGLDGTTRWVTTLGAPVDMDPNLTPQMMRVIDGSIHIVWPRFDGTFPADVGEYELFTLVRTVVDAAGEVSDEVEHELDEADDQPTSFYSRSYGLDDLGAVITGDRSDDDFTVSKYRPDGSIMWSATFPADEAGRPKVVIIGQNTVIAEGGIVTLLDAQGAERWRIDREPNGIAVVTIPDAGSAEGSPAILLDFGEEGRYSDEYRSWACILDLDGHQLEAIDLGPTGLGDVVRTWSIDDRVLAFSQMPSVGLEHALISLDLASGAATQRLALTGYGDDESGLGSSTGGVERLDDGSLLIIGHEDDWGPGGPASGELEGWTFLLRLPASAGSGDLSDLPVLG